MPLHLQKKCWFTCITIAAFLFNPAATIVAQPTSTTFQVIHLPRKAGYSKEKLNSEIGSLKDKEAVKKLLRSKNFPPQTSIIIRINRQNNQSAYWTINSSSPTDKEDDRIIMQSRDNAATKFFKLSEFKSFFKDTLALIDTLGIEMFIKDNAYPDDEYMLANTCGAKTEKKKIPFGNKKLLFTKELVSNCPHLPAITIYNSQNPDRLLASCKLNFVTADQKEMLLSLAGFMKAEEPAKDLKEIALLVYSYSINHIGRFHFPQLLNWLEKNNAALRHGGH